ncbi:MAG TPA: hypothetical protein VFC52_05110, partial [Solirubrobacterales bacterium]|nr:hypothetical protein [Solirubrobacterales bacterium]
LPPDSYRTLKRGLRDFLPADACVGIAYRAEDNGRLGLAADALLFFTPPSDDQLLDALVAPLRAIRSLVVGCERASTMQANYRVCTWGLTIAEGKRQNLVTRRAVGAGFDSDNGGEGVMLALAERLGWPTPLWQEAKEAA